MTFHADTSETFHDFPVESVKMTGMAKHARLSGGQQRLAVAIIVTACALAPLFFAVMFTSVVRLLGPSFWWAWAVPIATEASFVVLFLLDVLLEWCGKPMGWLRWAPYPFAAASLWLNVYSAKGDTAAMVGHGVVTVAFFLPLLAAKAAVRKLSVSDEDVKAIHEKTSARRYAMDLVRAQKGVLWRWRIPSLLRTQIVRGRFPAAVMEAVMEGAQSGGAAKWEPTVEALVTDGLTQRAKMTAAVKRQERQIERQAAAPIDGEGDGQERRPADARKPVSKTAANRARVQRILTATPKMPLDEVARKAGVSKSTVERVKREMPVLLRPAAEG